MKLQAGLASKPQLEELRADPDVREAALASERYALLNAVKVDGGRVAAGFSMSMCSAKTRQCSAAHDIQYRDIDNAACPRTARIIDCLAG